MSDWVQIRITREGDLFVLSSWWNGEVQLYGTIEHTDREGLYALLPHFVDGLGPVEIRLSDRTQQMEGEA